MQQLRLGFLDALRSGYSPKRLPHTKEKSLIDRNLRLLHRIEMRQDKLQCYKRDTAIRRRCGAARPAHRNYLHPKGNPRCNSYRGNARQTHGLDIRT
jgi:hypothetical protein